MRSLVKIGVYLCLLLIIFNFVKTTAQLKDVNTHDKLSLSKFSSSFFRARESEHDHEEPWNVTEIYCRKVNHEQVICEGQEFESESFVGLDDPEFYLDVAVIILLLRLAGTMSGLTLGLVSLDPTNLDILQKSGTPQQAKYATRVYPLVKRHHWLLVTLLLCNAFAFESLPLVLHRIAGEAASIIVSVVCVLFFGEILPMAVCTRHGLAIGAFLSGFVWVLMLVTSIISWPLGKLLDFMLGEEHGTYYRRAELKELVGLHKKDQRLTDDEVTIIQGALALEEKTVGDIITPMWKVYMIDSKMKMNHVNKEEIYNVGHSRVPVYKDDKSNVIGVLLVKSLILYPSKNEVAVGDVPLSDIVTVSAMTTLTEILNQFQTGKSHIALVKSVRGEMIGIVTIEDVIEELIQEEIMDETDYRRARYASATRKERAQAAQAAAVNKRKESESNLGFELQTMRNYGATYQRPQNESDTTRLLS